MGEGLVSDLNTLADGVTKAIAEEVRRPLAIFGHSMGSWLGLEVVRRLEKRGIRPLVLFTSGRHAPALGHVHPPLGHLDDDAFIEAVDRRYGGIPEEVMADRDLLDLFVPSLRADFVALESFEPPERPVETPIVAMRGEEDPLVSEEQLLPWAESTSGPFEYSPFPGGHFYFGENPDPLQGELTRRLLSARGDGRPAGVPGSPRPGSVSE
jgi:surfactin synthase thioesterase subunit